MVQRVVGIPLGRGRDDSTLYAGGSLAAPSPGATPRLRIFLSSQERIAVPNHLSCADTCLYLMWQMVVRPARVLAKRSLRSAIKVLRLALAEDEEGAAKVVRLASSDLARAASVLLASGMNSAEIDEELASAHVTARPMDQGGVTLTDEQILGC